MQGTNLLIESSVIVFGYYSHERLKDSCRILYNLFFEGAEKLYYYGLQADRVFATRVLLKLLAGNLASPVVAVFLAGLWWPRAVTSKLGRTVRRVLFRDSNE